MSDEIFLQQLGQNIRSIRSRRNITQNELANRCSFAKASMSRIEAGKINVSVLTLKKISRSLETEMSEFFK
jgi:transcriptional regulator with XRE-family HTH domain